MFYLQISHPVAKIKLSYICINNMVTLNANILFEAGGAPITVIKQQGTDLFFVLQNGLIYRQATGLFVNIQSRVLYTNFSEIGLLGLAFHPTDILRFFLWFSEKPNNPPAGFDHINRLEEWRIVGGVPQRAVTLLRLPNPTTVHNGNNNIYYDQPTNRLILATGDGGNSSFAQQDNQLFGKIIAINVDDPVWLTNENNTPITQVSQLGIFASAITVVSKGIRNPTRIDQKGGIMFLSVAGQSSQEFAFAFRDYSSKNFGWRAFEGPIPTLSGTTVSFPTEVIQLLNENLLWEPTVHYANSAAAGLPPNVFSGNAISGIDYYQAPGPITALDNNLIFTDLSGQIFQMPLHQSTSEIVLQISQPIQKITVNNLSGSFTTMFITSTKRILVAHFIVVNNYIVARISELTQ